MPSSRPTSPRSNRGTHQTQALPFPGTLLLTVTHLTALRTKIIEQLKTIYDPELPVDIYSLGLIYEIALHKEGREVRILMTLTTPNCPAGDFIVAEIKETLQRLPPIEEAVVQVTFDPPYHPDRMSQEAKASLGWL